jgi:hypothetical protein
MCALWSGMHFKRILLPRASIGGDSMRYVLLVPIIISLVSAAALAETCAFRTYGQAAWGTSPSGNNSAAYRNAHFADAFPAGVRIGSLAGNSVLFTSARAVQLYLPAAGAPAALSANATNATSTSSGAFGGEVLSLALNIGFDNADENFSASERHLENLTVSMGSCASMRVEDVLARAQDALAGLPTSLTAQQLSNCSVLINANFENGTDLGRLSCDVPSGSSPNASGTNSTPQVQNGTSPLPQNGTDSNATTVPNESNTTLPAPTNTAVNASAFLRIAPWYPKGTHYVFFCVTPSWRPVNYSWRFGDGEKLLFIRNDNVYHIFKRPGNYTVNCTATDGIATSQALLPVSVT